MNLDIILVMNTMDVITGAVVLGGVAAVSTILSASPQSKIQSCIDTYTFAGNETWRDSDAFVSCMKGQFPEKFAEAYKRKLKASATLKEENQ